MAQVSVGVHSLFDRELHEELRRLRHELPDENLARRYELLREVQPDLVERRLGYVPQVLEHGWAVIYLPPQRFAYTIGLNYHFGQPELLVSAPALPAPRLHRLLNSMSTYVKLRAEAGDSAPIIRSHEPVEVKDLSISLRFQPYSDDVFARYATGYLASFERYFEDREHVSGGSLPVLWSTVADSLENDMNPRLSS